MKMLQRSVLRREAITILIFLLPLRFYSSKVAAIISFDGGTPSKMACGSDFSR
jgi:hypothetical protein